MQDDEIARPHLPGYSTGHRLRIARVDIECGNCPQRATVAVICCYLQHSRGEEPGARPKVSDGSETTQRRVDLQELRLEFRRRKKDAGIVRQEVIPEFVTTIHDPTHKILMPRRVDADQEECSPRLIPIQKIDKRRGSRRVRTVVKGESNHSRVRPHRPQNLSCEMTCQVPCDQMRTSHTESEDRRCRKHHDRPCGCRQPSHASDQRVRSNHPHVTRHGTASMIACCGLPTRLPDARSRAELAGAARPLRCSERRRDPGAASRSRRAAGKYPSPEDVVA